MLRQVGIARKGKQLWGGVQGHSKPNSAPHLPLSLVTTRFSKVRESCHCLGFSVKNNHSTTEELGQFMANKYKSCEGFNETFFSKPEVICFALIPLCGFWKFNFKERMWVRSVCFLSLSFSLFLFWALYLELISWERVRALSSGMPAVTFRSRGEPRVYFQDAILSLIHCNKCHCKAGEGELAFINILQFWSPSGGR